MSKQDMSPIQKILKILEEKDPKFFNTLNQTLKDIDGNALDAKTRSLIKLVIASILGKQDGVKIHARYARDLGATEEEIAEAVRLIFLSTGMSGLSTAINALE